MNIDVELLNMDKMTKAVNGNLYINKVRCAAIQLYSQTDPILVTPAGVKESQLIKEAEIHCNNFYAVKTNNEQVEYVPMNLDLYMRGQIITKLLDMLSEKSIVYRKDDGGQYICDFSTSLKTLSRSPIGEAVMLLVIKDFIIPRLKEGERIWPNNLPHQVIDIVGKEHFHPREPKYIKKEQLRKIIDHTQKRGGPKL